MFASLPPEVWNAIFERLPQLDLLNMMKVCKESYTACQPLLYRCLVYPWIPDNFAGDQNDPFGPHVYGDYPQAPFTTIRDIDEFFEAISENKQILEDIREAYFYLTLGLVDEYSFKYLKLIKPPIKHLEMNIGEFGDSLLVGLTSVDLNWGEERNFDISIDDVYAVFSVPTLRKVTFSNLLDWNETHHADVSDRAAGTSNVETLILASAAPICELFDLIISWPTCLKRFHQSVQTEDMEEYDVSPSKLVQVLAAQKTTLEIIYYDNADGGANDDGTTFGVVLKEFTNLRSLTTQQRCLVDLHNFHGQTAIHDTIPSSIEHLCLDQP